MRTKAGVTIDAKGEVNVMLYNLPCSGSFGDGQGGQANGMTGLLTLSKEERMKLAQEFLDSAGAIGYFVITKADLEAPSIPGGWEEVDGGAAGQGKAYAPQEAAPVLIACTRPLTEADRKNIEAVLDGTFERRIESLIQQRDAAHMRRDLEEKRCQRLEAVLRGLGLVISAEVSP